MKRCIFLPLILVGLVLVFSSISALAQAYKIVDLGVPNQDTAAYGVNDFGKVIGTSSFNGNSYAVVGTDAGLRTLNIPSGYSNAAAYANNNFGATVGSVATPSNGYDVMLWTPEGDPIDLGRPSNFSYATAYGINDFGDIIGFGPTAFVWTKEDGFQDLGSLGGGSSVGWRINILGQAVGFSQLASGDTHAFLWKRGKGMRDLGVHPGGSFSEALGINNLGQIVGGGDSREHFGIRNSHAALWRPGKDMQDLGTLAGDITSDAFAVNDRGEVVGYSENSQQVSRAFVWTRSHAMQDLNQLIPPNSGWALTRATFVNLQGQITGYGTIAGQQHGFLLIPTKQ